MFRGGRPKDPVWEHFYLVEDGQKKSAQCKSCLNFQSVKPCRMKAHLEKCSSGQKKSSVQPIESNITLQSVSIQSSSTPYVPVHSSSASQTLQQSDSQKRPAVDILNHPPKRTQMDMNSHIVKTSTAKKNELDELLAEFVYACNLPFSVTEHATFKAFVQALRPGYQPPTRKMLGSTLLDNTETKLKTRMKKKLDGKVVTMQQDGWSDIHNNPVIATSVTSEGSGYFVDATDTGAMAKTAENCKELLQTSISNVEDSYGCKVRTVVTDNAKNMSKMRKALEEEDDEIVTYGCAAHWLNLLGIDITPQQVIKHVIEINKHFRNHHLPGAWLSCHLGSVKPQLPGDTRWKSQLDCLDSYMKNRPFMMQIVQEHATEMDQSIVQKIMNMGLYNQVNDLAQQLRPVAAAIDQTQSDKCGLADACSIFKDLMANPVLAPHREKVKKRYQQAILPCHLVTYMLHPKYMAEGMSLEEVEQAKDWLINRNEAFLAPAIAFQAEAAPYPPTFFRASARTMNTLTWWKAVGSSADLPPGFYNLMITLHSACASSAAIERVFSSFGLIQSKLRNKLGAQKAQKLVFCYRMLRGPSELEY